MRVAFCIDNMNVGGTELNAVRTGRHLVARGVDLRVFCLADHGPLLAEYEAIGIPVMPLPIPRLYGRAAVRAGRELARVVRRERIELVHAHDFYSNIFAAPWARLGGAKLIASRRWWEGPERRAQRWANRAAYVFADRVLANSAGVARLLNEVERVPARDIVVVPNFLDDQAFDEPPAIWLNEERQRHGLEPGRPVVGCVGSLSPIKDNALLLRAAATLAADFPRLRVVLVGRDAGSREDLERLAVELGIGDRVAFAGERPQYPSAHHLFDVSVLSSISEGLPNSILEAMAAARPVVATAVGAVADAVADGVTGYLVPPGDVTALGARLRLLLADTPLRARLGRAGRERARERHSADAAIQTLMQVYESVRD